MSQTEAVITDNPFESDEDDDETNANEIVIDTDIGSAGEDGESEQHPDDESDSSHDGEWQKDTLCNYILSVIPIFQLHDIVFVLLYIDIA